MSRIIDTSKFTFKLVPKTRLCKPTSSRKHLTKLIYAVSMKNMRREFKALVYLGDNDLDLPAYMTVDFTDDSFDIKGRIDIFSKEKHNGHYIRYIRTPEQARANKESPSVWSSFCNYNVYSGYLVKVSGVYMFEINEFVNKFSHCEGLIPFNPDEKFNFNKK